jgi:hypothetical protein
MLIVVVPSRSMSRSYHPPTPLALKFELLFVQVHSNRGDMLVMYNASNCWVPLISGIPITLE